MSWCIFHDYVIDSSENLSLKSAFIYLLVMSGIQVITIGVPNIIFHGAHNYYGITTPG